MNYIREFLYRPKRSDKSNMARFFYADENLTAVAAELDSFDGRKDPERCACLVNRLRSCQDKLLNICNRMLEELEPGTIKKSREFRAKYPGMCSGTVSKRASGHLPHLLDCHIYQPHYCLHVPWPLKTYSFGSTLYEHL